MTIDAALIGYWENADGRLRFGRDDWLYAVLAAPYALSADGQTLTSGTSTYTLAYGPGTGLVGVWRTIKQEPDGEWIEEIHYNADGSYTSVWTLNGAFDSITFGYYEADQGQGLLTIQDRRGIVTTGPAPGVIQIDKTFDPDQSGTYSISATGVLTLTLGGVPVDLNPV